MRVRSAVSLFLLLAGAVAGCATTPDAARLQADGETPRRVGPRERDMAAEAYYHYTVAQLAAQSGRFKDALAPMEEALRRDPNSSYLWAQLAQWLVRAEQPAEALTAARKAVQLAPDEAPPHLTLAELLRNQKKYADAEAELEKVIALSPDAEDAYLTLARYQVEQKR